MKNYDLTTKTKRNIVKCAFVVSILITIFAIVGISDINKPVMEMPMTAVASPVAQKMDPEADKIYVTATDVNARAGADINSKKIGTVANGVSVTIEWVENGEWGYCKEFKTYINMGYLKKVNPNDIIAIVSFPVDKEVPTYSKPNGIDIAPDIKLSRSYASIPVLYNENYIIIGDNRFVNKADVTVTYYQTDYYTRFVKDNTSRGFNRTETFVPFKKHVSTELNDSSGLSVEQIEYLVKGTELEGIGGAVKEIENTYGINAYFTLAVASYESGYGRSYLARNQNNIFGLDPYNGGMTFSSKSDCVIYFGKLISKYYFSKGLVTAESINNVYEPFNSNWSYNVKQIMNIYKNKTR